MQAYSLVLTAPIKQTVQLPLVLQHGGTLQALKDVYRYAIVCTLP
jgi:hypothetical protein